MSEARVVLYRGTYYAAWRENGTQRRRTLRTKNRKEAIERLDRFVWDRYSPFSSMGYSTPNIIYFITCAGFVKIGVASDPEKRKRQLQVGNPFPLALIAVIEGSLEYERHLHNKFAEHDHDGEWFHLRGELADFVAGLPKPRNASDKLAEHKAKVKEDIDGLMVFDF